MIDLPPTGSTPMILKILRVSLGYAVAVIVAVLLAVALFFATEREASGLLILIGALYGGAVVTFVTGLPGFLFTLLVAGRGNWSTWRPYAAAGAANAILAACLLKLSASGPLIAVPEFLVTCVPAGLLGGLVFWKIAGRLFAAAGYEAAAPAAMTQ
jgi:hypothetical protein